MKSQLIREVFFTVFVLCMIFATGCSGGGKDPISPGEGNQTIGTGEDNNPEDTGGNNNPDDPGGNAGESGIVELAGWQQATFTVTPSGGQFEFPKGCLFVPEGAVEEPVELSIAHPTGYSGSYLLQPLGYRFKKAVRFEIYNDLVYEGTDENLAVYHYRQADAGEPNQLEGSVFEIVPGVYAFNGGFGFYITHFSFIECIPDIREHYRVIFDIPPKYLPWGSVVVKCTDEIWAPGHIGIVGIDHTITDTRIELGKLVQSESTSDFAMNSTYWGAYLPPEDPQGTRYTAGAARQAIYNIEGFAQAEYDGYLNEEKILMNTSFVTECYEAAGRQVEGWQYFPRGWVENGDMVNEITINQSDPAFDIYVTIGYCDPAFKTWGYLMTSLESGDTHIVSIYPDGNRLRARFDPGSIEAGTYKLKFSGYMWPYEYRSDYLTINVTPGGVTDTMGFRLYPDPPDEEGVYLTLGNLQDSGALIEGLTYDNFSLEVNGVKRLDFGTANVRELGLTDNVEIAFLVSYSSGMYYELRDWRDSLYNFAVSLYSEGIPFKFGGLTFRHSVDTERTMDLTGDVDAYLEWAYTLNTGSSGTTENVPDSILYALNNFNWSPDAVKFIVVVTDSRMHYAGDGDNVTYTSVAEVANILLASGFNLISFAPDTWYYDHPPVNALTEMVSGVNYTGDCNMNRIDLSDDIVTGYFMSWVGRDSIVEPNYLVISAYRSPEDKFMDNPWKIGFGYLDY